MPWLVVENQQCLFSNLSLLNCLRFSCKHIMLGEGGQFSSGIRPQIFFETNTKLVFKISQQLFCYSFKTSSILKAFHLSGFPQRKEWKAEEMGHESSSGFWTVEMAAGSAFQVSFRFGGDSLGWKTLKRLLLLKEQWGFPATPEL